MGSSCVSSFQLMLCFWPHGTDLYFGSSHLPSALVAAFIKRLARLSLSAPPASIVTIIPFTYNMLKLHPGCMTMIHRPEVEGSDDDIVNGKFGRSVFESDRLS